MFSRDLKIGSHHQTKSISSVSAITVSLYGEKIFIVIGSEEIFINTFFFSKFSDRRRGSEVTSS